VSEEQEVISVSEYVADYEQLARIIFSPSMVLGLKILPQKSLRILPKAILFMQESVILLVQN